MAGLMEETKDIDRVYSFNSTSRRSDSAHVMPISSSNASPTSDRYSGTNRDIVTSQKCGGGGGGEINPQDAWLPLTESRQGNVFSVSFHLMCSGIGVQALLLPVAFATLGWIWGTVCLSLAFTWQLYTKWLLVQLHESNSGAHYSRYLGLAITVFGQRLGKILALVPVMYLSVGTCIQLIIIGGGTIRLFIRTVCRDGTTCDPKSLTGAECFLVFVFMAVVVAQFPNLNSLSWVSFIGTIAAVVYCALIWGLSVGKGRIKNVSYDAPSMKSDMDRFGGIMNAIGIICLAFRGHNVVLEIQGTLPTNPKLPTSKTMWRGVAMSSALVAMCLVPLAIAGFWSYGNKVPSSNGGLLIAIMQFHTNDISKVVLGLICILVIVHCLSSFQIYGMVIFDKMEGGYTGRNNKPCAKWLRAALRVLFGGLTYFAAVTFPFLGSLAPLLGGLTLPLTYVYPCFMWIGIKKPQPKGVMWCVNMGLGLLGSLLSLVLVIAAAWNLGNTGLHANFYKP